MTEIQSFVSVLRVRSRNWRAIVLCVLTAMVFWFFNALNKNYTTNISFPVQFDYDNENYIAVRPLPTQIRVNVTGMGWDLFRRSLGLKIPPLIIPIDHPTRVRKIAASSLPGLLANQLERFEINFVLTDTLHIALEPKEKRWITLKVDVPPAQLKKGFIRSSPIKTIPDSIFIEGPWKLVQSFQEPYVVNIAQKNIDENFKDDIEVIFPDDELVRRVPPTVSVSFTVDEQVNVSDSVRLKVINYPSEANPFYGVERLSCVFAIPQSFIDRYHRDSVTALVNLKGFTGGSKKVVPEIVGLPPYSQVVKIDTIFVKL